MSEKTKACYTHSRSANVLKCSIVSMVMKSLQASLGLFMQSS